MIILEGKSVFGGVAIGRLKFYKRSEVTVKRSHVEDTAAEVQRFEIAKMRTQAILQKLYDDALSDVGEANAMIFEVHQMMLEDLDYIESILGMLWIIIWTAIRSAEQLTL